jgi:hypothetical protein
LVSLCFSPAIVAAGPTAVSRETGEIPRFEGFQLLKEKGVKMIINLLRARIEIGRNSPPCITARRGGGVIKKISRSHRNRRRRGGFPFYSQSENHPGLAVSGGFATFNDCEATPPCCDARRGVARDFNSFTRS